MEIIKIGIDAFKLSLSEEEAKEYNIKAIDQHSKEEASASVKALIEKLKNEGVDFGKERVSAEIFLSKSGGCEIFLSKANEFSREIKANTKPLSKAMYRFSRLSDLLNACAMLKRLQYNGNCSIHHNDEQGSYYLALTGIYRRDDRYSFLNEFGERVKETLFPYIKEYCRCICDNNAVEIFSKLL